MAREYRRAPVSQAMKTAEESIEKHRAERRAYSDDAEQASAGDVQDGAPETQRRWWKGLGQIVQGAATAGADIGLAIVVLHFPIPKGGETYGVVMSVAP